MPRAHHEPLIGYAICTIQRSGSTWFAEMLRSTNALGRPSEYFSTNFQRQLVGPTYPSTRRAQVELILTKGATPNGVYGFKVFPPQLEHILRRIRWSESFPDLRMIYWTRRDLLGQAISKVRVQQTQQWRSTMCAGNDPTYDAAEIEEAMRWIAAQAAQWEIYFARNGITPLRLVYEDALAAPQAAVDAVARHLGLEHCPAIDPALVEVAVQRDASSEDWRLRFLADRGDLDLFPAL